jgi:hypothetical protein
MPIQGLTTGPGAFPKLGTLRKGGEKTGNKPGPDLTYFRFDTQDAHALEMFTSFYGKEPRAINVFLPYPTLDENYDAWREHWVAGGLMHRCDGETCARHRRKDGSYSNEPIPCPEAGKPEDKRLCQPVARLAVIIPELKRFAFVTVLTSSLHDIRNLHQQLTALEQSAGTLRGIPLVLRRAEQEISTPAPDGKRLRRTKSLLSIEARPQWVEFMLESQEQEALKGREASFTPALPEPEVLALETGNGQVINASTGEVLDATESQTPGDTRLKRYSALGKKLKGTYHYTDEQFKEVGALLTKGELLALNEEAYLQVIDNMEEMERNAIYGDEPAEDPPF